MPFDRLASLTEQEKIEKYEDLKGEVKRQWDSGADLGGGCRGCTSPSPRDDLRFSNTTGIMKKKTMWFIGVEVEQETSALPPKKSPGSAPGTVKKM